MHDSNPGPEVQVVRIEFGRSEMAASLNSRIDPARPILLATLDVRWRDPQAASALRRIEKALASFSPSFRSHQCGGAVAYRVFANGDPKEVGRSPSAPGPESGTASFDPRLALAHLIEHAVIDFESSITHETRLSGITGARREGEDLYDIMVECPEAAVGRLCLALAILSLTGAVDAHPPGRRERDLLATARSTYRSSQRVFTPPDVARAFDWPLERADRALSGLHELGYLARLHYAMNFSGAPCYRMAPDPPAAPRLPARDRRPEIR